MRHCQRSATRAKRTPHLLAPIATGFAKRTPDLLAPIATGLTTPPCRMPPQCRAKGFNDISVFVLDLAGRTLVSKTMVGVPNLIPTIAAAKAGAAIGTHSSSRTLKDKYVPDRTPQLLAMTTLGASAQRPFAAVPGGVLCRDAESGAVIGAIGVSGASADEDEHCAVVGAHACGFQTEPAKSALQ